MPDAHAAAVCDTLNTLSIQNAQFTYEQSKFTSDPRKMSPLEKFATGSGNRFNGNQEGMSCFEVLIVAATVSDKLSLKDLKGIFTQARSNAGKGLAAARKYSGCLKQSMTKGQIRTYSMANSAPRPEKGDIVFINDTMHVAMATGNLMLGSEIKHRNGHHPQYTAGEATIDKKGTELAPIRLETEVNSFWPRYPAAIVEERDEIVFTSARPISDVSAGIEVTTIEDLVLGMALEVSGSQKIDYGKYKIEFARPAWAAAGY